MMKLLGCYVLMSILLLSTGSVFAANESTETEAGTTSDDSSSSTSTTTTVPVPEEFLAACTQGDTAGVEAFLKQNPNFLDGRSADGETCLHVAGIYGHAEIAELVLQAGGDPNIRSTFDGGLRMPPLTWNVFGGHADTAKVLLENGADVNLDFDSPTDPTTKVTAYDMLLDILEKGSDPEQRADAEGLENYWTLKQVLESHGAKRWADIAAEL